MSTKPVNIWPEFNAATYKHVYIYKEYYTVNSVFYLWFSAWKLYILSRPFFSLKEKKRNKVSYMFGRQTNRIFISSAASYDSHCSDLVNKTLVWSDTSGKSILQISQVFVNSEEYQLMSDVSYELLAYWQRCHSSFLVFHP